MVHIEKNKSLQPYNTFGISVIGRFFTEIKSIEAINALVREDAFNNPRLILGGGSNILFTKDFDGIVVKNSMPGIEVVEETEAHVLVKIAAGEIWHEVVQYGIEKGWGGIENLSLIPGQAGAAPMQNIGAYGVEIKDVFVALEAYHIKKGHIEVFDREACQFGYRESVFKKEKKDQYIICSITLKLTKKNHAFNTSYGALASYLEEKKVDPVDLKSISNAVIAIRQSKLPDPKKIGNAGSFFKNPIISRQQADKLKTSYPSIPMYPSAKDTVKIPAGWLIEQAGWKGKRMHNYGVHDKQALVLVHYGNASGSEIWKLAQSIQKEVFAQFSIELIPEVNIYT